MLKILTVLHTLPSVKSYRTLCFNNLLPYLRTKTDVHITWLVYQPERLELPPQNDPQTSILDIHDFKNALDVVQHVNPDVMWVAPTLNLPDHALALAGKYLGIPTVGELPTELMYKTSKLDLAKTYSKQFFESSVPTDVKGSDRKFMRRGRFFFYKYQFVLKTQLAVKMNFFKIIKNFVTHMYSHFSAYTNIYDSRFAVDLHFVETEKTVGALVKNGFKKSSLVITGIPMYDDIYDRLEKAKVDRKSNDKIRILLLTAGIFEHGFWTRTQRDSLIQGIVSEIGKHKDRMSLTVKIHPSSELLSDYQELIHPIDDSIPIHQKGDLVEFIQKSDVVVTYSGSSSLVYAIVGKKPIIVCNFYNMENDLFQEKELVYQCKNKSTIISSIEQVLKSNPATKENIDSFIDEYFYKLDGRASERIGDSILDLVKQQ